MLFLFFFAFAFSLRVEVVSLSQVSHILSLQGVAFELQNRGHTVSFVSFEDNRRLVDQNLSFVSVGAVPHPQSYYGFCQEIFGFLREINDYSTAAFPVLKRRFEETKPDVIAFDCTYPVILPLCETYRCVCIIPNDVGLSMLGSNHDLEPCMISGLSSNQLRDSYLARVKNFVLTRVLRYAFPFVVAFQTRGFWREAANTFPPSLFLKNPIGAQVMIISNAAYSVIKPNERGPLVQYTGPWLPRPSKGLDSETQAFLDQGPFVYVSIGTNAEWVCSEAKIFSDALSQLQMRVLWSVKSEQSQRCEIKATSAYVRIVPFVDQLAVLQHKNVKVFVSHCGWSSLQGPHPLP